MNSKQRENKFVLLADHGGLLVLILYGLLCCYFYLERTTFLDNPFSVYKLIQEKALHVSANRWPAAIIKILPLLAIKAQLSLKTILLCFSFSYFLFHLSFFLLIRYRLKDKIYSWLLIATLLLPVAHSFYWNNSELILGLSMLCYWLALLRAERYLGSIVVGLVMAWLHPLLILLVVYSIVLLLIENKKPRKLLVLNGGAYISMHLIKEVFFPNYYDSNKTVLFKKKLSSYSLSDGTLFELISDNHHLPLVIGILLTLVFCFYKRKIIQAFLLAGFCLCYLFINDLGSDNTFYVFYHETNFLILFFAAAFTFCITKLWDKLPFFKVLFALCLLLSFARIMYTSEFYKQRIAKYTIAAIENDRAILSYGKETRQWLVQDWASAFESLIISTIKDRSAAIIFSNKPQQLLQERDSKKTFITGMGKHFEAAPDSVYFRLVPQAYREGKAN